MRGGGGGRGKERVGKGVRRMLRTERILEKFREITWFFRRS